MTSWDFEHLFPKGDEYANALEERIKQARVSIEVEVYIYSNGVIGRRICDLLCEAAQRGVKVRIVIDGFGSSGWESAYGRQVKAAGAQYRVYHRLFSKHLTALNKRTHRKLFIIDSEAAFVGSRNISDEHFESLSGERTWFDISIEVRGEAIADLKAAFERSWVRRRIRQRFQDLVRLNATRRIRRVGYRDLNRRILGAQKRVWIMSSYFIPTARISRGMAQAARRGIDVRLILPIRSDVFFIPWVTSAFEYGLIRAGVKAYEYLPSILHAKATIVDDWMMLGSSNYNHRSMIHDLEVDIVLSSPSTKRELATYFEEAMKSSKYMTIEDERALPLWQSIAGKMLYFFRFYL